MKTLEYFLLFLLITTLNSNVFSQAKKTVVVLSGKRDFSNIIGEPGAQGFGVGTVTQSELPAYIQPLSGTYDKTSDNYGNYKVTTDNSIMVWIPMFYYKISNVTDAPYYGNKIEIAGYDTYGFDTTTAAADGYAIHRAFIDGGELKKGFFIDKYGWSLTNVTWDGSTQLTGIASSIKNGNPISSNSASKRIINGTNDTYAGSFSNCISNSQAPADIYGGAWSVAKSRGNDFAVMSMYQNSALAMLSMAHQQASDGDTTYCAWNDVLPYAPKGNNRGGVLNDQNDASVTWTNPTDGYWNGRNEAAQTGSADPFAKSTHNGQGNGVADLNGNQWRIMQGITAAITTVNISGAVSTDGNTKVQVTTSAAHGLSVNDWIMILSVTGMTDLQGKLFKVTDIVDATNFKVNLATTQTYTSGGVVHKGSFYSLKESIAIKDLLEGNSTTSHHFGAASIAANYDVVLPVFADGGGFVRRYGNSTNQLLSEATDRTENDYRLSGLGFPSVENSISTGGTNSFGQDYYYQYLRNELCALAGGNWPDNTISGVWAVILNNFRAGSNRNVSGRSCLYL